MKRPLLLPVFAITLGPLCAHASDLSPLGLYVGAAAGPSDGTYSRPGGSTDRETGWKVLAGLRPIPLLGAEYEHVDFGDSRVRWPFQGYGGTVHARADGLFAMGYLLIPVPLLDVFARVGWEQVHAWADGYSPCSPGPVECLIATPIRVKDSESDVAYGAAVQVRLRSVALRAAYERTQTSYGHPALLSFGMTYTS